jgi:chaperonin cofactor prefoldin
VQQSERIITELEQENEQLKTKIRTLQSEIDEFNASLADI